MSTEGGAKAVVAAMIANGGIAITKFLAFFTAEQVADTIDDAEARIRAEMPTSKWIYLEPDIRRADSTAGADGTAEAVGDRHGE